MRTQRRQLLEFAVLGLLHEAPMHGYELRRRLNDLLGAFRALSFGTLYPCLARLLDAGWICEVAPDRPAGGRQRITYEITAAGRVQFDTLARTSDPSAWDDEGFGVRLAFFARTEQEVRLRVLEGRRARVEQHLAALRARRRPDGSDTWTSALHRRSEESLEGELRWLGELVATEQATPSPSPGSLADPNHPAFNPGTPGPASPKENPA